MPTIVRVKKDRKEFLIPIPADKFEEFEERHGQGSIERILTLLADERPSLRNIGSKVGISHELVRHFFNDYLVSYHMFDSRPRIRMSIRYRKKRLQRGVPKSILFVWRKARKQGIKVEPVARKIARHQPIKWRSALVLNWIQCKIHVTSRIFQSLPHFHQIQLSKTVLEVYPIHIIITAPLGNFKNASLFIIPSEYLIARRSASVRGNPDWEFISLYLPVTKSHPGAPSFLERFRDAWHLLK